MVGAGLMRVKGYNRTLVGDCPTTPDEMPYGDLWFGEDYGEEWYDDIEEIEYEAGIDSDVEFDKLWFNPLEWWPKRKVGFF